MYCIGMGICTETVTPTNFEFLQYLEGTTHLNSLQDLYGFHRTHPQDIIYVKLIKFNVRVNHVVKSTIRASAELSVFSCL